MKDIKINCHSSIKIIDGDKNIYFDPFKIEEEVHDADLIFITHDHYDHFEPSSINNICNSKTKLILPEAMKEMISQVQVSSENLFTVEPNNKYLIEGIEVETVPSYNPNKQFHPKENNWVGYILNLDDGRYYVAGDTDITDENQKISVDVALVPIGGTYTMTREDAAKLINIIKPKVAIPTHYGEIVGNKEDGDVFKNLIAPNIKCEILIK